MRKKLLLILFSLPLLSSCAVQIPIWFNVKLPNNFEDTDIYLRVYRLCKSEYVFINGVKDVSYSSYVPKACTDFSFHGGSSRDGLYIYHPYYKFHKNPLYPHRELSGDFTPVFDYRSLLSGKFKVQNGFSPIELHNMLGDQLNNFHTYLFAANKQKIKLQKNTSNFIFDFAIYAANFYKTLDNNTLDKLIGLRNPELPSESNRKKWRAEKIDSWNGYLMRFPDATKDLYLADEKNYAPSNITYKGINIHQLRFDVEKKKFLKDPRRKKYYELPKYLKNDHEIILALLQFYPELLLDMPEELRHGRGFVLELISNNVTILPYLSKIGLEDDREIVMAALLKQLSIAGGDLKYASNRLRGDREIVMAALTYTGRKDEGNLGWTATKEIRSDRGLVLEAIKTAPKDLFFASAELRDDREIVLYAIRIYGPAIEFASKRLKNDRDIVLMSATNNSYAFSFASDELKQDEEFVWEIINNISKSKTDTHRIISESLSVLRYASEAIYNQGFYLKLIPVLIDMYKNALPLKYDYLRVHFISEIPKGLWQDPYFVLVFSGEWAEFGNCDFYNKIPDSLQKNANFSKKLIRTNPSCKSLIKS